MTPRRYPDRPLLGVGGIVVQEDQVLLVQRAREPQKGLWSIPGGLVKVGETLAQAVRREVEEETGLRVEPVRLVEVFERIVRDGEGRVEYHYVVIDYLCKVTGGRLRPASDVDGVVWARRGELGVYPLTEGTAAVIEKAFDLAGQS